MLFLDKMSTTIACFGLVNSDLLSFSGLIKWPGYGYLLAFCKNQHYAFFMDKTSFPWLAVDLLRTTKLFCWFPSPTLAEGSTIARWDRIFACQTLNDPSIGAPGGSHVHRCEQPPPVVFSTAFLAGYANTPRCLAPFEWEVNPPLSLSELSKLDMFVC